MFPWRTLEAALLGPPVVRERASWSRLCVFLFNDVCFCCVFSHQGPYCSVNWVSLAFFLLSIGWFLYILTIVFFKWNMLQMSPVVCGFILTII